MFNMWCVGHFMLLHHRKFWPAFLLLNKNSFESHAIKIGQWGVNEIFFCIFWLCFGRDFYCAVVCKDYPQHGIMFHVLKKYNKRFLVCRTNKCTVVDFHGQTARRFGGLFFMFSMNCNELRIFWYFSWIVNIFWWIEYQVLLGWIE